MDFFKLDPMFDTRLFKDIYLGLCSALIFTSFVVFSREHARIIIIRNIEKDNSSFHLETYISSGVFYTSLALGLLLSPGIIARADSKYSIVIGTTFRLLHMTTFFTTQSIWFYLGYLSNAFGDALLWTGLSNYLVLNSEIGKVYFGISVFWIFYQFSDSFGRMIIHFKFDDLDFEQEADAAMRSLYKLVGFVIIGIVMLFGMKQPLRSKDQEVVWSPRNEILKTLKLLITSRMLPLIATMITIAGAFSIAVGGKRIGKLRPLISLALMCNLICYLVAFFGLPDSSARFYTEDLPIVPLTSWILVIGAVLSGMGDAFLFIGMSDILGAMYPNNGASAFAVFKLIRSIGAEASSHYEWSTGLHIQIVILMVLMVLSWLLFTYIDWLVIKTTSISENRPEQRVDNDSIY